MFLSWKHTDTSPAGDSPVLSCGHAQLPARNAGLLQPLRKRWFIPLNPGRSQQPLWGMTASGWAGRTSPCPVPRLGAAGTGVSALLCCLPLVPRDTCSPGINGADWGGIRAAASGSISTEVGMVPSSAELPKSVAGEGCGWHGMACRCAVGCHAHLWHVLAQPRLDKPGLLALGSDAGLALSAVSVR